MGSFNKFDKGRGGFGGERKFGGNFGGPRHMFQATCSQCGKSCEVPFKPTGERPVYCSDCFKKNGGPAERSFAPKSFGNDRKFSAPQSGGNGGLDLKAQFNAINTKLDKLMSMINTAKIVDQNPAMEMAMLEKAPAKKTAAKKSKAPVKKAKAKKK